MIIPKVGSAYPEFELPDAGVLWEVEPCLGGGLLGGIFVDSGMVKVARSISKFGSSYGSSCVAAAQKISINSGRVKVPGQQAHSLLRAMETVHHGRECRSFMSNASPRTMRWCNPSTAIKRHFGAGVDSDRYQMQETGHVEYRMKQLVPLIIYDNGKRANSVSLTRGHPENPMNLYAQKSE